MEPVRACADLLPLRKALAERAADEAAAQEAARLKALRDDRERRLFELAVGPVAPLKVAKRVTHPVRTVDPAPLQRQADEEAVMREALSDEFDVETLLHTDDMLSYRAPGLGQDVVRKLREGRWSIQRQIDLHGLRTDEARARPWAASFATPTPKRLRCEGGPWQGLGSPGRAPVLKGRALRWLVQKKEVLAFVQARPAEGGAGALVVLLRAAEMRSRPASQTR
ncbi:MAG: Smr/MutS family protein [Burkholderiaceae bacterium]